MEKIDTNDALFKLIKKEYSNYQTVDGYTMTDEQINVMRNAIAESSCVCCNGIPDQLGFFVPYSAEKIFNLKPSQAEPFRKIMFNVCKKCVDSNTLDEIHDAVIAKTERDHK